MINGKTILVLLTGLVAGITLGILFAPQRGKDTRAKLSKKTQALADELNDTINEKFDELITVVSGKPKATSEKNVAKKTEMVS